MANNMNDSTFFRFFDKVLIGDGCWEWQGARNNRGYGTFSVGGRAGKRLLAHRVSYEMLVGPIPDGLQLDHICRNPACVRPDGHLEPVTNRENQRRGLHGVLKETCAQGHPWVEPNIGQRGNGERYCLVCKRLRDASWRARKALLAASGAPAHS